MAHTTGRWFRQQAPPRDDAVEHEDGQKNRHRFTGRDSERDRRHQPTAVLGVTRSLGCDHSDDVAAAK